MRTPKSMLLRLDCSTHTVERIRLVRQLAETFNAEVTGLPCKLSALMRYPSALEAVVIMQELDQAARDEIQAAFAAGSGSSLRIHWAEPESDGPRGFARHALYAGLMVLGQRDQHDPTDSELPGEFLPSVLVAWKETRESARAVSYGEDAEASLKRLQDYLRVQGIQPIELHSGGNEDEDAGNKPLSFEADVSTDLLVMGCYGHSRVREWVLGGATLSIRRSMTLPVLMLH